MAPKTRSKGRQRHQEYNTPEKARFFNAWDNKKLEETFTSIATQKAPSIGTAHRWLQQRDLLGSPATRRTRKLSTRLGRHSRVSAETCHMLVSPSQNPVRDQQYEAQIEYHQLPIQKRQLQRRLKVETRGGQRRKQAYVKKRISPANKIKRTDYGKEHQGKTVQDFWQWIVFTDEAHIDPSAQGVGFILREDGTREDPENIQERGEKTGVKLHVAAWVNWHAKCDQLEFYNDEEEHTERPKRAPKPRTRKWELEEEYKKRVEVWEAELPHQVVVKPKGNAMTQKYYVERLLPIYCNTVIEAKAWKSSPWLLQEDNDPSHGTKKKGLATRYKRDNHIVCIIHPPQSPDLNPIEACWNILKQRVRKRVWRDLEELKAILQDEWSKITMQEVRARIKEMPGRCKLLVKTGGKPIKSKLW
jgi:hypothetical protein